MSRTRLLFALEGPPALFSENTGHCIEHCSIFQREAHGASRLVAIPMRQLVKQVDLSINGIPGKSTIQDGISCPITPPIQLAKSATFTHTRPIVADSLFPIFVRKEANGLSQLPQVENLQTTLAYDDETYVEHGGIPCRAYFFAYSTMGTKREPIDWDLFNKYARPMSNWFSVEAFPNPASLVTLEMTPPPSGIFEGQEAKIPVTILPLPGRGTGQITNDGGQINLLDGYETQNLEDFSWTSRILPPTQAKEKSRVENLEIKFKPKQGAGNYEIEASATLTVKENETGSVGKVTGKNTTMVPVQPITATLKSIEFLSDHNILKKNPTSGSIWGDSNNDYETPEWVAGVRSNPISHTKNTKITATVKIQVKPVGTNFDLIGAGENDYVSFEKTGQNSTGEDQEITVTANSPLPDQICILEKKIIWKIKIGSKICTTSSSTDHKIYVTYDSPKGSSPTDIRLSWSCEAAWGTSTPEDIAKTASSFLNTADPPYYDSNTNAWPDGTPPIWFLLDPDFPGGSCIAHSNLLKHILNILGVPGGSLTWVYASTDRNFDSEEIREIHGRQCKVFVFIEDSPNLYEGCLEMNSLLYPGVLNYPPCSSKLEVHSLFAAPPNRLIYRTAEKPSLFFDKNLVEYDSPLKIPLSECISIP